MVNDFRFALRSLRRRPTFAAAVMATLALGIGTSAAVFSLLDAALLRRLPFSEPTRLVMLCRGRIVSASYVEILLAAVALAASYLPSRSAARIDPQQALKSD